MAWTHCRIADLPAFGSDKRCRVTALVMGDAAKGERIAAQFGVSPKSIWSGSHYERLGELEYVDFVYMVLPNSMHAEDTVRAARAGKHVPCEKPMATSVTDDQHMIEACAEAKKAPTIAYCMQHEPYNRELTVRRFVSHVSIRYGQRIKVCASSVSPKK